MTEQTPPEKKKAARANWGQRGVVLFLLAFAAFVVTGSFPSGGVQKQGCQTMSRSNMKQIAAASELYAGDHGGALPERLSQLFPDYIGVTEVFYLRCRYANVWQPPRAKSDPGLIDVFSPYALARLGDGRGMVFERLPMWSDGTAGFYLLSKDAQGHWQTREYQRFPREEFGSKYFDSFD